MRALVVIGTLLAGGAAHADTPSRAEAPTRANTPTRADMTSADTPMRPAVTAPARADKPMLAALAPADDARRAIAIGPAGQVYEPDGTGAWVRTHGGGIANDIVAVSVVGGTVVVGATGAPPFKLDGGTWSALHFDRRRVRAILGAGSRALAAVGRSVFALDKLEPTKLAEAPAAIRALAGSARNVVIATDGGLMKLAGSAFRPIPRCPKSVRALISDRWALLERGAFDLATLRTVAWPAGVQIVEATTVGNDLVGVSQHDAVVELVTIKGRKLVREPVPISNPAPIVGIVADKHARVAIAMSDGRIALRDGGTWTVHEVREQLPAPKPGPAPAKSR